MATLPYQSVRVPFVPYDDVSVAQQPAGRRRKRFSLHGGLLRQCTELLSLARCEPEVMAAFLGDEEVCGTSH